MVNVRFAEFESRHIDHLAEWLVSDHVAPWFPQPETYIAWATSLPGDSRQYVVSVDGHPVGYIRWTYVSREVLDNVGFHDIPSNSADMDLLVGDKRMIGCGLSEDIFRLALARLRIEGIATLVALTTSVNNLRAHRAFERAGFIIDREYNPEGFGKCYLMLLAIHSDKAVTD